MINRALSIFLGMVFLGSSLGVHVFHHDAHCCGQPTEILQLTDLISLDNFLFHSESEIAACSHCPETRHHCDQTHGDHQDCCYHEILILKDTFFSQLIHGKTVFSPDYSVLIHPGYALSAMDATKFPIEIKCPPPLKTPRYHFQFTGLMLC